MGVQRRESAAYLATFVGLNGEILFDTTNKRLQAHDGVTPGGWPVAKLGDLPGRNLLINGNFAINQRGYVSGAALAAGAYAHDRWKDQGAGTWVYTYTQGVPDTLITITAGVGGQVVEPQNVAGGSYVLSWAGTAPMTVYFYTSAGLASAQSAMSPVRLSGVLPGTSIYVENGGLGTLGLVQLEVGTSPTVFERRQPAVEQALCQRYYWAFTAPPYANFFNAIATSSTILGLYLPFPVTMRTTPTVTLSATTSGTFASGAPNAGYVDVNRAYLRADVTAAGNYAYLTAFSASAEL